MENGSASDSSIELPPEESAPERAAVGTSVSFQPVATVNNCFATDSRREPPLDTPGASFTASMREKSTLGRAEVDTSAPFQSVKEAVDRFGGSAVWNLQLKQLFRPEEHHSSVDVDLITVEEQDTLLEKDLIMKERETLDVLKKLVMTKKIVDGLKMKFQKETIEGSKMLTVNLGNITLAQEPGQAEVEKFINVDSVSVGPKQSAGFIAMELKQAKKNLNRATNSLADIQESIELFNHKIKEERHLLGATQEHLDSNVASLTSLEEEFIQITNSLADIRESIELLNHKIKGEKHLLGATQEKLFFTFASLTSVEEEFIQITEKLQKSQYLEGQRRKDMSHISQEINRINAEMEQSRKVTEAAKLEVDRLIAEVEQRNKSIKTAEIRILAAKKIEEAARAAEAAAVVEIKALMSSNNLPSDFLSVSCVTLSTEEYTSLMCKVQEAEEVARRKIEVAMEEVNETNRYRRELLFKVEEANAEAKSYKSALEDALKRVEDANRGKLAVEEALQKWTSEQSQRRHIFHNTTKFKSYSAHHRRDSRVLDLNGSSLITDPPNIGVHPPLSIGQILTMKLMVPGGNEWEKENEKPQVSLGQMLNKKPRVGDKVPTGAKRKKLGFVGLSLVLAKQNNKKRQSLDASSVSSFGKTRRT